jgi:hypothetical protein
MVVLPQKSKRLIVRHLLLALIFVSSNAKAALLSESYSKVLLGGTHVGYTIQRYEFDQKKKEFIVTYFVKTGPTGGNLTESLKARSSSSLKPIAYQYTQLVGEKVKMLDATIANDTLSITVVENGQKKVLAPRKIPKDAFLASFLGYVMLQGKEGIKTGVRYSYQAIAEEDGQIYKGDAYIAAEEAVAGVPSYKVLNTFMNTNFIYWITPKGEFIASRSPVQQISTEVVPTIQEAVAGLSLNSATLTQLFGSVPKGEENAVAKLHQGAPLGAPAAASTLTPGAASPTESPRPTKQQILDGTATEKSNAVPGKKSGVPAGSGLQLKGGSGGK